MSEKFILPEDAKGASFEEMVEIQEAIVNKIALKHNKFIEDTIIGLLTNILQRPPAADDFKKITRLIDNKNIDNRQEHFYFDGVGLGTFSYTQGEAINDSQRFTLNVNLTFTLNTNLPPLIVLPKQKHYVFVRIIKRPVLKPYRQGDFNTFIEPMFEDVKAEVLTNDEADPRIILVKYEYGGEVFTRWIADNEYSKYPQSPVK